MGEHDQILSQLGGDEPEIIREGAFAAGEARFEPAIELLARHLTSQNLGVQEAADHALRKIGGPGAVKAVIPLLRSDDPPARNLAMDILREIGDQDFKSLVDLLHDADADVRIFSADILGETGNPMAVGVLCKALLSDPEVNVRYQAAVSLGNLAMTEAAKCLNKALSDEEWVQFAVIEALTKVRDESSVKALIKAMDSSTELVQSMIVEALGEMGSFKAATTLIKRLGSSTTALRNKIVKAVVNIMGGKSLTMLSEKEKEDFRQYLLAALKDEDQEIQDAAVKGLSHVGGEPASRAILKLAEKLDPVADQERLEFFSAGLARIGLTEALEEAVRSGPWKAAMAAVNSLAGAPGPDSRRVIMDNFWDKDQDQQRRMIEVLAGMAGPEEDGFFMDVLRRSTDGETLKCALRFIGGKRRLAAAVDDLFALLEHPFDDVKEEALEALAAIGGPAIGARFQELSRSPEPVHRFMAVYAMGKIGLPEHFEDLKSALEDEIPDVRKVALEAVFNMCGDVDRCLSLVVDRLSDEDREVRLAAVQVLGGCEADEAAPYLKKALGDPDDWVRIRAVEALGRCEAVSAVSELTAMLEDPNKLLVLKVAEALGAIGGKTAFRALFELVKNDDPEIQEAAEAAMSRINSEQGDGR